MSLILEMRGIAPRTSGLISGRSTIWPTSHVFQISRNFFSLSQQLWSFSFRSQKIYLLGISICSGLSGDSGYHFMSDSRFGDAGHWSPNLSHAKRALYHLTYIPSLSNLAEFFPLSQQLWSFFRSQKIYLLGISICNRLSADSDYHLMSVSSFGDAGHRSPYLSHAKRSLLHLSYIPMFYNCGGSFCFSRQTRC